MLHLRGANRIIKRRLVDLQFCPPFHNNLEPFRCRVCLVMEVLSDKDHCNQTSEVL